MPTYEYECEGCHHSFEIRQRSSCPPPKSCPRCRAPVRKVFYPVGVIFKGSGWHVTDYDSNGPKGDGGKSSSEEEPSKAKASEKASEKSESSKN